MKRQLKISLIHIVFSLMYLLVGGIIVWLFFGTGTLRAATELIQHGGAVQREIKELENVFNSAIASRQIAALNGGSDYRQEREKVFEKISNLETLVSDDATQTTNALKLHAAVEKRFLTQDALYNAATKTTGGLIFTDVEREASANAQTECANALNTIKTVEMNLLFERLAQVAKNQWLLLYIIVALVIVKAILNPVAHRLTVKTLRQHALAAEKWRIAVERAEQKANKEILIDSELAEQIQKALEDAPRG